MMLTRLIHNFRLFVRFNTARRSVTHDELIEQRLTTSRERDYLLSAR